MPDMEDEELRRIAEAFGPEVPAHTPPEFSGFPIAALVPAVKDIVLSAAELVQAPVEMSAQTALGVVTAITARKVKVAIGSRTEPTNLWTLIVAPSSERKSSIMGVLQRPLESIETELRKTAAPKRAEWESNRKLLVKKHEEALRLEAKGKSTFPPSVELNEQLRRHDENEVVLPRFFADDTTPEAMAMLLTDHAHLSIMSAEATIIGNMAGKYQSKGATQDLTFWNKAWSADKSLVDRAGGKELSCNPCLSIASMIQNGVLHQLAELQDSRVSGLLSKFLYTLPKSIVGVRTVKDYVIPTEHETAWAALLKSLTEIPDRTTLTLSDGAKTVHNSFCRHIESELGNKGKFQHIADWCGKLQSGQQLRIAAMLHCMEHADHFTTEISEATQRRAVAFCNYYLDAALKIFEIFENPHADVCKKILAVFKEKDAVLARGVLYRKVWITGDKKETFKAAVQILLDMGTLTKTKDGDFKWNGQPLTDAKKHDTYPVKWEPIVAVKESKQNIDDILNGPLDIPSKVVPAATQTVYSIF